MKNIKIKEETIEELKERFLNETRKNLENFIDKEKISNAIVKISEIFDNITKGYLADKKLDRDYHVIMKLTDLEFRIDELEGVNYGNSIEDLENLKEKIDKKLYQFSNFKFKNSNFEVIELNQKITVKRLNKIVEDLIRNNLYVGIDKNFVFLLVTNKEKAEELFKLI